MPDLHIGKSGYQYDHWRGVLYLEGLPRDRWLAYYADRFSSVELNTTFYGLPRPDTVASWRKQVPDGFVFATKLSRYGTHFKHLREPDDWLGNFLDAVAPLGPALGPILAQLPSRWHCDLDRLAGFLAAVPTGHRLAVELRDASWLCDPVFELLREHGAALCVHDLVESHPRLATAEFVYLRFHGPRAGQPYAGSYSPQALSGAARRIRRQLEAGRDVYAYFNRGPAEGRALPRLRRWRRLRGAAQAPDRRSATAATRAGRADREHVRDRLSGGALRPGAGGRPPRRGRHGDDRACDRRPGSWAHGHRPLRWGRLRGHALDRASRRRRRRRPCLDPQPAWLVRGGGHPPRDLHALRPGDRQRRRALARPRGRTPRA